MTTLKIGMMPKSARNPYFEECRLGAAAAADELGFELDWDGPPESNAAHQTRIVNRWIQGGLPVIAVSVENSEQLSPILRRAREKGRKVLTWDADAASDARDFAIVHATPESLAHALSFEVGRVLGGRGRLAAITSTLDAPNQRAWVAEFRSRLSRDYPDVELADVRPCHDDASVAAQQVEELLETVPDLAAVVAFCSPAVPAAADALRKAGRTDVRVTGVSLPSLCKTYIEEGAVDSVVIWQTRDLGYLAALAAHSLATGGLQAGATSLRAGRLGTVVVLRDQIRLGRCHIVTRGNLAEFV
jgi:rhamnose transport system permease protein